MCVCVYAADHGLSIRTASQARFGAELSVSLSIHMSASQSVIESLYHSVNRLNMFVLHDMDLSTLIRQNNAGRGVDEKGLLRGDRLDLPGGGMLLQFDKCRFPGYINARRNAGADGGGAATVHIFWGMRCIRCIHARLWCAGRPLVGAP